MKQHVFLALSLLVSTSVFAGWMPSKDSAQYHGTQFVAGFAAGYVADSIGKSINENKNLSFSSRTSANNLTTILMYVSTLKTPDALGQTKLLKPYADQNKTDSGRWAYFLGMHLRSSVWRVLGY